MPKSSLQHSRLSLPTTDKFPNTEVAMNNPGTILKMWTKIKEKYEGKKPALIESGVKQKTGIKKGLTQLRDRAAKAKGSAEGREAFLEARDNAAQAMSKYFRFLNASKTEDTGKLPQFKKKLKALTVVVL